MNDSDSDSDSDYSAEGVAELERSSFYKGGSFTVSTIERIMNDIKRGNQSKRQWALHDIVQLSAQNDRNRAALSHPELQLFSLLRDLLRSPDTSFLEKRHIITIFAEWAALKENKLHLAQEEQGLPKMLFQFIHHPETQNNVFVYFVNCGLEPETHEYFLSERLGLAQFTREQMLSRPEEVFPYWFFTNIAATMNTKNFHLLLDWNIHEIFMRQLFREGNNPARWLDRFQGVSYRSLFSIFYLSIYSDEGRQAIMQLPGGVFDYFHSLYLQSVRERVPAAIILCNISPILPKATKTTATSAPTSLKNSQISLLQVYPDILELLVTVFYANLHYETDPTSSWVQDYKQFGYNYGIFKLRAVTASLKQLAYHPHNHQLLLCHSSLLGLCAEAMVLFLDDAPECSAIGIYFEMRQHAGGGGRDFDSMEAIIEMLLQLSFEETERIEEGEESRMEVDDEEEERETKSVVVTWRRRFHEERLGEILKKCLVISTRSERALSSSCIRMTHLILERL